jgi:hypothetical protein
MTTRLITWTNIKPGLVGVLLSSAGMFLGYELGSETARLLGGEPLIWARISKGLVWGAVIGGLQWPIVRAVGVLPVRFLVASAAGFAAGYPLGQTIQANMVFHWGLHLTGYWSAIAAFGLFLGVPQWWIFRRHMKRASLWVLFSVIGWMLTGVARIGLRAGDGLDYLWYGIVTGLGLAWLARSQPLLSRGVSASGNE